MIAIPLFIFAQNVTDTLDPVAKGPPEDIVLFDYKKFDLFVVIKSFTKIF